MQRFSQSGEFGMPGYSVLALVSGGKDSCYNAMLCQQYGHELVVLGNLHPVDTSVEELDSYMYQTVGHGLIEAYAECTGLPLLRKRIVGSSVEQGLIYEDRKRGGQRDEVEDLEVLMKYAKDHYGIQAVSSGAIASDYQRSRVERICSKLGLISLAYMWHQPQSKLLREMIQHDIDARLIKVAAAGLDPERHLGKSLREMEAYLHRLRGMYGINVCGEGGEYETLTLDCPLFRRGRIVLDESEVVVAVADSLAPVAWLRAVRFHVEEKGGGGVPENAEIIEVPDDYVGDKGDENAETDEAEESPGNATRDIVAEAATTTDAYAAFHGHCASSKDFGGMLRALQHRMEAQGTSMATDCVFVTLFVDDMAQFGTINRVYARYFPPVNPPARATLEKRGKGVSIHILCSSKPRSVLHVQSMSRWAPSCIGPYSQATYCDGLVRFAGIIALEPETSDICCTSLEEEVDRVALTCELLGQAMKVPFIESCLWALLYVSEGHFSKDTLEKLIERRDADDHKADEDGDSEGEYVEEYLTAAESPFLLPELPGGMALVIECPHLPRNARVELQAVTSGVDELRYQHYDTSSSSSSGSESDGDDGGAQNTAATQHGWLENLSRMDLSTPKFSVRAVLSPNKFAKIHMVSASPVSELRAGDIVDAVVPVLESAALSTSSIAVANAYMVDGNREALEDTFREALEAALFAIDKVLGVSFFDTGSSPDNTLAIEIFASS